MKTHLLLFLLVLIFGGCQTDSPESVNSSPKASNSLTVSAAADLTPAFSEIGQVY